MQGCQARIKDFEEIISEKHKLYNKVKSDNTKAYNDKILLREHIIS